MPLPYSPRLKITPDRLAALVTALAPLLYFYPATLGRLFLVPADGVVFNVPLRVAAARVVAGGSLPLWNPYVFAGLPLLGAAQGGLLFPLNWFFLLLPAHAASNLMMLATYALAGVGAYLYARRSGSNISGALLTGFVWQACGFMVAQIGHTNVVQTAAMLPWVLWAVEACAADASRRRGVVLAALVAAQVFAGHSQTNAYALVIAAAYALVLAYTAATREGRRSALRALAFIFAGLALAAVQILPTLELLRASLRADASYEFFSSFSMPPRFALTLVAPYVLGGGDGTLFRAPYTDVAFYAEYIGYVGLAPLALAFVAPLTRRDARTRFWAAVAVVAFALALGRFLPFDLYAAVYRVPVLNLFRVPARHLMEFDFALAVLAGRALTQLASAREARGAAARLRGSTTAVVAVVSASLMLMTVAAVTVGRPADFRLGRLGPVSVLRAPELFMPVVLAVVSAWAVLRYARTRKRRATALLFVVVVFDLCLWGHASGWRRAPRRDDELWREPPVVRVLREREGGGEGSYRVLTVARKFSPEGPTVAAAPEGEFLLALQPNTYMMHGVENAAGYDGFGLERYSRLAGDMKVWGELTDAERTLGRDSRELDVLNVRYLVARNPRFDFDARGPAAPAPTIEQTPQTESATQTPTPESADAGPLGLPPLNAGERLVFETPNVKADALTLVTNLSWAAEVEDGTTVARVRLRSAEGRVFEFDVRAGRHTSEWSYDRDSTRASVRHERAAVASTFKVSDPSGDYEGHTYLARFTLPSEATITGGEMETERLAVAPKLGVSVEQISVGDSAVRRGQVRRFGAGDAGDEGPPAAAASRWRHVTDEGPLTVYENTRALPRAWLAPVALALADDAKLKTVRTGLLPDGRAWNPLTTALVDSDVATELAGAGATEAGRAEVTRHEPNRVEVTTESGAAAILVLADNHYPGWRAYVDGRAVETLRVNYNLRGVLLEPGRHNVAFLYRPKSVAIGLAISLLAAAALGVWCAREKREGRPLRVGRPSRAE
ncbi:MAG TPA: YfhO family protein [Pyrinomonadaceae bacterium]|nr:YfhO family protein [Pyrinomonadaceae bacterium]